MTSPMDTTLRARREHETRPARRLVALCVASELLDPPRSMPLIGDRIEIGRATGPAALGVSTDPWLSRKHALIEESPDGSLTVSAVGSARIAVNGREVRRATLSDGDAIVLGETILLVREGGGAPDAPTVEGLVGDSPAMRAVRRAVARVAPSTTSVLLLGESGTGKEVIARALHARSDRRGELVAVNCAAIPATLAESQLFGHAAGAFTGAQRASEGWFRSADGGTLFLDEIGDLPLELQPKLLRALEEKAVVAVGATSATPVDVRIVTATNRDLIADVKAGRFRGDLYARLAEFTLELPPLRARREDIIPILTHHLGGERPALRFATLRALLMHPWPFNVRELRTIAAQLRMHADTNETPVELDAIEARLTDTARLLEASAEAPAITAEAAEPMSDVKNGPPTRAELETLLREYRGNVTELARAVGRSRKQVYRWLEQHALDAERFRDG